MTDITIPPEALRAARAASMNARGDGDDPIRAACLAMLKNWPGMHTGPAPTAEIARLRAENERLRAVLGDIHAAAGNNHLIANIARAALEGRT